MQRRHFLERLAGVPFLAYAILASRRLAYADTPAAPPSPNEPQNAGSLQSFGFYEPLGATDEHDPSETDGTDFSMPCITAKDIGAAVEKTYPFWHGHGGVNHLFTVTAAAFKQLQKGQAVLVYTTVVEDHRHPLVIDPANPCAISACREIGVRARRV
jgi:hypothetical protein